MSSPKKVASGKFSLNDLLCIRVVVKSKSNDIHSRGSEPRASSPTATEEIKHLYGLVGVGLASAN